MFPAPWKDAVLMSLSNDTSFHFNHLSKSETEQKLKEDGDFLIQSSLDGECLLLSARNTSVHEFPIYIVESPTNITYNLGRSNFHTYEDLIEYFKKEGIRNAEDQIIKFSKSVACTKAVFGRFGAEFRRDLRPRCPVEVRFDLGIPNPPCRLVAVRKEISALVLDDELEKLVKIRHENVISLLDFEIYGRQSRSRLVTLRNEFFDENLYDFLHDKEPQPLAATCKWIKQAAEAMSYLNEAEAHYTLVCAQDSYLDAAGNLKIGGVWIGKWPTMIDDTVKSSFYWRFCSPDFLIYQVGSSSTLMFNWSAFSWQIATRCQLPPFSHYQSAYDYVLSQYELELPLPSTASINLMNNEKIKGIKKTIDLCNRLPDSLNRAILGGIGVNPMVKLRWNELVKICKYEHRILSLVHVVKKFLPFA